ncbi:MAG: hypothetical protein J5J00_16920 [Deltaproteobacteria bacterium]|nr:hypothetical protein [Deltaproteobacteria bacterium]
MGSRNTFGERRGMLDRAKDQDRLREARSSQENTRKEHLFNSREKESENRLEIRRAIPVFETNNDAVNYFLNRAAAEGKRGQGRIDRAYDIAKKELGINLDHCAGTNDRNRAHIRGQRFDLEDLQARAAGRPVNDRSRAEPERERVTRPVSGMKGAERLMNLSKKGRKAETPEAEPAGRDELSGIKTNNDAVRYFLNRASAEGLSGQARIDRAYKIAQEEYSINLNHCAGTSDANRRQVRAQPFDLERLQAMSRGEGPSDSDRRRASERRQAFKPHHERRGAEQMMHLAERDRDARRDELRQEGKQFKERGALVDPEIQEVIERGGKVRADALYATDPRTGERVVVATSSQKYGLFGIELREVIEAPGYRQKQFFGIPYSTEGERPEAVEELKTMRRHLRKGTGPFAPKDSTGSDS